MVPGTEQVSSFITTQNLNHANSHSSLGSMLSTFSTHEAGHLSNKARMELRAYAILFEQATVQRRRSY
jgi:hypothetical protein